MLLKTFIAEKIADKIAYQEFALLKAFIAEKIADKITYQELNILDCSNT
jgi:hypothetical protein